MPQYKDTIVFPPDGKIDVDSEVRRIKKGDIIDAKNVRWGTKNDGTVFAVENIKGNELYAITLPQGNNKTIGGCQYYPDNSVLIFLYNDQNKHCILRVDMLRRVVEPILWQVPELEFSDGFIMNAQVLDGNLIWLNTNGELKNLIIEKAQKLTNDLYFSGIGYWIIEDDFIVQHN